MDITGFLINHRHYWGIPHTRSVDGRFVQTCYECGAESEIKIDLRPSPDPFGRQQESAQSAEGFGTCLVTEMPELARRAKLLVSLQSLVSLTVNALSAAWPAKMPWRFDGSAQGHLAEIARFK